MPDQNMFEDWPDEELRKKLKWSWRKFACVYGMKKPPIYQRRERLKFRSMAWKFQGQIWGEIIRRNKR